MGDIVLFGDGYVCTKPQEISRRFANFVCPENVMEKLPHKESRAVAVLNEDDIGALIVSSGEDARYPILPPSHLNRKIA